MSTEYRITSELNAFESSSKVRFFIEPGTQEGSAFWSTQQLDQHELRKAIVKLVHVLSYISDDPNAELKRFNVDYNDEE